MAETDKKFNIKEKLDNLINEEGLRTDITITLTPQTRRDIFLIVFGAGLSITAIAFIMRGVLKNMAQAKQMQHGR